MTTKEFYKKIVFKDVKIIIQEDGDKLGLIIDVYNNKDDNHIDSMTIWYDDLTTDYL